MRAPLTVAAPLAVTLALAAALAACSKDAAGPAPLPGGVPPGTDVVVELDAAALWRALEAGSPMFPPPSEALKEDLVATTERIVGVAPRRVTRVVVLASVERGAAVALLEGDLSGGAPKGEARALGRLQAVDVGEGLLLARDGERLIAGNEAGLRWVGEATGGDAAAWEAHRAGVGALGGKDVVARVSVRGEVLAGAARGVLPEGATLRGVHAVLDARGAHVSVLGDEAAVKALGGLAKQGLETARAGLAMLKSRGDTTDELAEALGAVAAYHSGMDFLGGVSVREEAGAVRADAALPGGSLGGVYLPVLAAVAVPSFLKYMRRAETTEARVELDRLYRGAALHYATPRTGPDGQPLPCAFPPSQSVTPAAGTCCGALGGPDRDGDGRCDGDPAWWKAPGWEAAGFALDGPHRFVYAIESEGTGADATVTVSAYGDLDCDGVMSTFQRTAFGDSQARPGDCAASTSSSIYVEREAE